MDTQPVLRWSQTRKEPAFWGTDATPALNIHSFLAHRAHSPSSPQQRASQPATQTPGFRAFRRELPREPASGNAEALSADSTLLSTLDNIGAENNPNNFRIQCISKAAPSNLSSNRKAKSGGHLFLGTVFGASNSLSAKVKTINFPHSGLSVQRLIHQNVREETKTAGYFSPSVYN